MGRIPCRYASRGARQRPLVKKALLVSDPQARAKLYEQAQEIFYQQAPWITLATGKTFYATRSNVSGYTVSMMGSDFSKAKLN